MKILKTLTMKRILQFILCYSAFLKPYVWGIVAVVSIVSIFINGFLMAAKILPSWCGWGNFGLFAMLVIGIAFQRWD